MRTKKYHIWIVAIFSSISTFGPLYSCSAEDETEELYKSKHKTLATRAIGNIPEDDISSSRTVNTEYKLEHSLNGSFYSDYLSEMIYYNVPIELTWIKSEIFKIQGSHWECIHTDYTPQWTKVYEPVYVQDSIQVNLSLHSNVFSVSQEQIIFSEMRWTVTSYCTGVECGRDSFSQHNYGIPTDAAVSRVLN